MTRPDLLALTPQALAALANRGLVKRATKEVDAGNGPAPVLEADGTVRGRHPDGTETTLPADAGLEAASCTCAATGMCRHIIALVLAYQRHAGDPGQPAEEAARRQDPGDWSPGTFDDETLSKVLGGYAITAARRIHRVGYTARIRRPTADDPAAEVELPTCTVRFLVPGELGYVHTDASATARGPAIVLAVWAFRAADETGRTDREMRLDVGGDLGGAASVSGLEPALALVEEVLLDGAVHTGPLVEAALRTAAKELTSKNLHWPAAALEDLAGQLTAYRERDARHAPERFAELLAELYARHHAALHPGGSPRSRVLGTDEPARTPLRHIRLTALGCRVGGTDRERTAAVYLAQDGPGTVLVLERAWKVTEEQPLTGHAVSTRRIAGAPLHALASATVLSEDASRTAGRLVRLGTGRVAKTTVTPLDATAWAKLPEPLLVRDLRTLDRAMSTLPPRLVRPRVAAELVHVIEIAEVIGIGYNPGAQRLEAVIADGAGTTATVSSAHNPHCPGALDRLAEALSGDHGTPRHLSASVTRARGVLVLDPLAVLTDQGVVIPDLAPGDGDTHLQAGSAVTPDPLTAALDDALAACAEAAHHGLRHTTPGLRTRLGGCAAGLEKVGLRTAAGLLNRLATALTSDEPPRMVESWVNAHLRLLVTAELR